jgi:hypothetical protein
MYHLTILMIELKLKHTLQRPAGCARGRSAGEMTPDE